MNLPKKVINYLMEFARVVFLMNRRNFHLQCQDSFGWIELDACEWSRIQAWVWRMLCSGIQPQREEVPVSNTWINGFQRPAGSSPFVESFSSFDVAPSLRLRVFRIGTTKPPTRSVSQSQSNPSWSTGYGLLVESLLKAGTCQWHDGSPRTGLIFRVCALKRHTDGFCTSAAFVPRCFEDMMRAKDNLQIYNEAAVDF